MNDFVMLDPIYEGKIVTDETNNKSEHRLIDDIDKNRFFMQGIEEIDLQRVGVNNEARHRLIDDIEENVYFIHDEDEIDFHPDKIYGNDNNENILHEENDLELNHDLTRSFGCSLIGKKFNGAEHAYNFYNEYGLSRGFGIRKHYTNRRKGRNEIYRHVFVCNKQGFKNVKRITDEDKCRCIKRTGCMAMIQVTFSEQGTWVVDKFDDEHNHPLDDTSRVPKQWSHKVLHRSKEWTDLVTMLSKTGMRPSDITKIVNAYKGNQDDNLTRVECSAIVSGQRKVNLGKECHGIIMHFQEKAELDKDFFFAMDLCTDGTFRNLFWADGRSRSSYNKFGDVVVFDVTYKTNTFSLPFAPFVGVNHHGQTMLFGAALLENETEATFV